MFANTWDTNTDFFTLLSYGSSVKFQKHQGLDLERRGPGVSIRWVIEDRFVRGNP